MKKHQIIVILLLSIFIFSCTEKSEKTVSNKEIEIFEPAVDFDVLKPDFKKWWTYHYYNISLSSNFTGINEQSDTIAKEQFLNKLISANYIPLKLKSNEGFETYKLFKLDSLTEKSIGETIKDVSLTALKHFKMEGQPLPQFDFIDLQNNHYTSQNTKGKIIILKTWFIGCTACVAEFPELNELVKKYKHRNDIVFVSLATDSKSKLVEFLNKKVFEYGVVPDQKEFIVKKLKLQTYPTHIIIDENGTIVKVVDRASEMIAFLDNVKKLTEENPPPPAPMVVASATAL